jgi:thymidine kinase
MGPMFSGKTNMCLLEAQRYISVGRRPLIVKPSSDTRDARTSVLRSHNMHVYDCERVERACDIPSLATYAAADVILVDEGQFFTDLVEGVKLLLSHGKNVHVYGLSGNAKQEKLGHILDIIPLASDVTFLKAYCVRCTRHAAFTVTEEELPVGGTLIGGSEIYSAVCRRHITEGWKY